MEELNSNDIHYLVAVLADEESPAVELKTEFEKWRAPAEVVQSALAELVKDGTIGITHLVENVFNDFSPAQAMDLINDWPKLVG